MMLFAIILIANALDSTYDCVALNSTCNKCLPTNFPVVNTNCSDGAYAYAAAYAFTHRLCIASNAAFSGNTSFLSTQEIISCDVNNNHCKGTDPFYSFYYIQKYGLALDSCFQMRKVTGDTVAACNLNYCDDFTYSTNSKYFCKAGSVMKLYLSYTTPADIKNAIKYEISTNGGVVASMSYCDNFIALAYENYADPINATTAVSCTEDLSKKDYVVLIGYGSNYWIAASMRKPSANSANIFRIQDDYLHIASETTFCRAEYN